MWPERQYLLGLLSIHLQVGTKQKLKTGPVNYICQHIDEAQQQSPITSNTVLNKTITQYKSMLLLLLLLLNRFSRVQLCATPQTASHQAPPSLDSPGKNTGVGCHFLLQYLKVKSESEVTQSCPTRSDPMDCSLPGSSVHGFSRQEYWSGLSLPSPYNSIRTSI